MLLAYACGFNHVVYTDSNFEVKAYGWVSTWYMVFAFDQVYIKYVVDNVKLSVWGRSYITNLLACVPLLAVFLCTEGLGSISSVRWDLAAATSVILSCLIGVAMSYSAFALRGMVSATTFTVVGTLCKIGTVAVNCLMWDNPHQPQGCRTSTLYFCWYFLQTSSFALVNLEIVFVIMHEGQCCKTEN